ncbi:hypothetical protein BGZ94_002864 [Podila epigama]|nr:hypothetical protein BGZ94_002864 [Podila epigama]
MAASLKIQPLTSKNRPGAIQVVFDQHMRSVPALYNFLKLRPITLVLWTAISTAILRVRKTNLYDLSELGLVLSVCVIMAHGILFLALLYDASSNAPGPEVVGRLDEFVDQDAVITPTATDDSEASSVNVASAKKRTLADKKTTGTTTISKETKKNDSKFWVLEKDDVVVGTIGALVDKAKGEAQLVSWAVSTKNQMKGAGTLLLKTAMEELCRKKTGSNNKKSHGTDSTPVTVVRVVLQGYQVSALRILYQLGFKQVERTPEWLGERVVVEMQAKDWIKNHD